LVKIANSKQEEFIVEQPLKDKVVLLFDDGATEDGRSLAVSLAKYGADVSIVYYEGNEKRARETKEMVIAEGRRCLIVPSPTDDNGVSKEAVGLTIEKLGQLDILIDHSSSPESIGQLVQSADNATE